MFVAKATHPTLTSIAPFFIVRDLSPSIAFYRDRLGFELVFATPDDEPFFAILERDDVRIMIKAILPEVHPLPNHKQHPWARWDAFIHTPDPDSLAAEFTSRGVAMHVPLADTDDQLRGFEIQDQDGYVLFFGRPV
jgi:catechol 2,3-dioxygenase-like lactoylglutathione lyase family enzyme